MKNSQRFLSLTLAVLLLVSLFPVSYAAEPITSVKLPLPHSSDPFAEMTDPELKRTASVSPDSDVAKSFRLDRENPAEGWRDQLPDALPYDADAGKTDRFIVQYRSGYTNGISSALGDEIARSISPERSIAGNDKSATESLYEVIVLNEKVLPSELVSRLKKSGIEHEIEYIQPDFKLAFSNLELTLLEDEIQDTDAETLEPEDKSDAEPSLEPETTTEPAQEETVDSAVVSDESVVKAEPPKMPVTVAVIDTGVQLDHPLLSGVMHEDSPDVYDGENSIAYAHGTHVSGIIAETIKGTGIQIYSVPVFESGYAYTSDIIIAIENSVALGAQVINCSFGSTQYNRALFDAIEASGALFICAAGNSRMDLTQTPVYPASYDLPNVLSVGSVNADDGFSYFSNYGGIDLTAPGRDIVSALPGGERGVMTGTSMSAALVTGAAAMVLGTVDLSTIELRSRLLDSADRLTHLEDKLEHGRRLNLENALAQTTGLTLSPEYVNDFDVHGYTSTPEELNELFSSSEIVQISAGGDHSLLLKSDGTVWAWGNNMYGQCGTGTVSTRQSLAQVIGLTDVVQISAGLYHNLALKSDGTVWGWGNNEYGQIGDGSMTNRHVPVQITNAGTVVDIAAGHFGSAMIARVMIQGPRLLICEWGFVSDNSCSSPRGISTQPNESSFVVSVGSNGMTLIGDDVYTWGVLGYTGHASNGFGQVTELGSIQSVSSGANHCLAMNDDGEVWFWGASPNTITYNLTQFDTAEIGNIKAISAGGWLSDFVDVYSLFLRENGTVMVWDYVESAPYDVVGLSDVAMISAGGWHALALKTDGTLWVWGDNTYGQLGDSGVGHTDAPFEFLPFPDTTGDTLQPSMSLAVTANDTYQIALSGTRITSFSGSTYQVTYNPNVLRLVDFAAQTSLPDLAAAVVPQTGLTILTNTNGSITFRVDRQIPTGQTWSGIITLLRFEALTAGTANISVV